MYSYGHDVVATQLRFCLTNGSSRGRLRRCLIACPLLALTEQHSTIAMVGILSVMLTVSGLFHLINAQGSCKCLELDIDFNMGDNSSLSPSTILWNGLTTPYLVQDPNLLENFIKKFENVNVTSLTLSFNRAPLTFSKIDIDWSAAVKARRVSAERFFSTSTTGSVTFAFSAFQSVDDVRDLLLALVYDHKGANLTVGFVRIITVVVNYNNGIADLTTPLVNITIEYIGKNDEVERNDAPSVDIGFSSIGSDKIDFKEGSLFGTYVLSSPHRIRVIDEDTTVNGNTAIFHYINRLVVILKTTGCGKLDYDETTSTGDFLYWLKPISDDRIKLVSVGFVNGTASYEIVLETEGVVSNQSDAAALDDVYEDFVGSIRFINNKDEPTLYCDDGQGNITKFERQTMVIITDNGSPPQSAVITTTINIQTINDHKPTFIFYLSPNDSCLALKNSRRRRSLEKKPSTDSTKDSPPSVSSLTAFGFSDGKLSPGSSIWVNFSHDTNMPQVLTRDQLEQIVKISPSSLAKEIHLGFWATSKSLVIVYPAVRDDIDTPLHTKDIALTFMSRLDSSEGCKYSVCHSDGQSRGVQGTFSVEGSQEQQQPKAPCDDALSDQAIDIEQTQLHDWALIGLAFAGFIIAVSVVIYLGCRRTR